MPVILVYFGSMKLMLSIVLLLLLAVSSFSQVNKLKGRLPLISVREKGENISLIVSKPRAAQLTINFYTKGSYTLQSACNSIGGKYTATGKGGFKFSKSIITAMYCSKEANNIDGILGGVLSKVTKYQVKGKTLILQDKTGSNMLVFDNLP